MKYWLGLLLLPFVAWLAWQTHKDWQRVEAARAALPPGTDFSAQDEANPLSLAGIGEMVLPFVLTALAISAMACVAIYRMTEGARVLTLFDIAMALAAIAVYGLNFTLKVKHRMPKTARAASARSDEPMPWPQRLAWQAELAGQAERKRLREAYAPDSRNTAFDHRQDRERAGTPAGSRPAALEQTP